MSNKRHNQQEKEKGVKIRRKKRETPKSINKMKSWKDG
jgi:hypothetical protein